MSGGPVAVRLPVLFDAERLREDLARFEERDWVPIRSGGVEYDTGWKTLPLRSRGGDPRDGSAGDVGSEPFLFTPLVNKSPYIVELLCRLDCTLRSVRLSSLAPGARIAPHADHEARLEPGHPVRLHVPITGEDSMIKIGWYTYPSWYPGCIWDKAWKPGEFWYGDFGLVHEAENRGPVPRVHLLIVAVCSDWLLDQIRRGT